MKVDSVWIHAEGERVIIVPARADANYQLKCGDGQWRRPVFYRRVDADGQVHGPTYIRDVENFTARFRFVDD